MDSKCICCGNDIPEGIMICKICTNKHYHSENNEINKETKRTKKGLFWWLKWRD